MSSNDPSEDRTELAEDRTDWAMDRTMLANMRTYAGWMRTGMAAMGVGLGVHALFGKYEPLWLARALASLFVIAGIIVIYQAYRNAKSCHEDMDARSVEPMPRSRIALFTSLLGLAGVILLIVLWTL